MSIEYNWGVNKLEYKTTEDNLSKVIKRVHWYYTANEGELNATTFGFVNVYSVNPSNFIPFENLTEQVIKSWIEPSVNHWAVKKDLQDKLVHVLNQPDEITNVMPWQTDLDSVLEPAPVAPDDI